MSIPIEAIKRMAMRAEHDANDAANAAYEISLTHTILESLEALDRSAKAVVNAAEGIRRALKDAQSKHGAID